MCGIVGVISGHSNGFSSPEADAFTQMLFIDTLRGWDSTGVFNATQDNEVHIYKEASAGPVFIQRPEFKDFRQSTVLNGRFAVGHNRAATRGTINDKNAHPFWVNDKIVLVHNGTFFSDHKHLKNTDVDSEAIAHLLAEDDDVEKVLQKINCAYALVWYNVEQQKLNIIRNSLRPMNLMYTKGGAVLFASEPETLGYVAEKHRWQLQFKPYEIAPNTLIEIQFTEGGYKISDKELDSEYKSKVVVYPQHSHWQPKQHKFGPVEEPESPKLPLSRPWTTHSGSGDIRRSMRDLIPTKAPQFLIDEKSAQDTANALQSLKNTQGGRCIIELQEYLPANDNVVPTSWVVFGTIIEASETGAEKACLYWYVHSMSEERIINYVAETFYEAEVTTVVNSPYHLGLEIPYNAVSAYCANAKPLKSINKVENAA